MENVSDNDLLAVNGGCAQYCWGDMNWGGAAGAAVGGAVTGARGGLGGMAFGAAAGLVTYVFTNVGETKAK